MAKIVKFLYGGNELIGIMICSRDEMKSMKYEKNTIYIYIIYIIKDMT